jgi:hypothetical protein
MNNKWWEYYVVRYFVGTVVGAVIVAFLNGQPGSPYEGRLTSFGEFRDSAFLGFSLVAALGFAFCYIASSPMLTLHAGRAHLRLSMLKTRWISHLGAIAVSIVATTWAAWAALPPVAAVAMGVVLGGQIGLVLLSLFTRFGPIEEYYRTLATARAAVAPKRDEPPTAGLEYVTSYRHLREHGNAIAIVVLEGILAYALFGLSSVTCAFFLLAAWLLPATAAWIVGTALESRLVSRPLP